MARPIAVGLKYFPFDVDLLDNEALDILREEYGMVVNSVYISLLCLLYKKYGYFIPYETPKDKEECIWYIFKKVRGGKYPPSKETISQVIDACVARELFSRELYPKIITSKRAQATFYSATVERKSVPINPDLWLLGIEDMEELSRKHPYYLELCPNDFSDEEKGFSDDKSSNSNEKSLNKIKPNQIKSEDIEVSKEESNRREGIESYDEIFETFNVGGRLKSALIDFIRHLKVNGIVMINSRLNELLVKLDLTYGNDELAKCREIRRAITNGYKRLECEGE